MLIGVKSPGTSLPIGSSNRNSMGKSNQAWQDERDELNDCLSNHELREKVYNDPDKHFPFSVNPYYSKMQKGAQNASHEAVFQWEEQLARAIAWEVGQRMHFVHDMHHEYPPTAEVMDIARKWIEYFVKMKMI